MKKAIKIIILLAFALIWMFIIFKLSGMTSKNSNGKSTDIISIFIEDTLEVTNEYGITSSHPTDEKIDKAASLINAPMRKVIHASVYFALAFFVILFINVLLDHKNYFLTLTLSGLICIVFAMSDELHQTFVSGRTGQLLDVLIDSAGAFVGIAFYSTYHLVYRNGYKNAIEDNNLKQAKNDNSDYNNEQI